MRDSIRTSAKQANVLEPPTTFSEVLQRELECVNSSRQKRDVDVPARVDNLIGLAFSGGGIRSATFNLGILQALAKTGLLHKVDYLSTVSGGGYIGSWFAALTHRFIDNVPGASFRDVEEHLSRSETSALRWLRHYSNFLTLRTGPLSSETWAGVTRWLRNVFINHVTLGLALTSICLALHSVILRFVLANNDGFLFLIPGVLLLCTAFVSTARIVQASVRAKDAFQRRKTNTRVTLPFVAACVLLNCAFWQRTDFAESGVLLWAQVGACFYFAVWSIVALIAIVKRQWRIHHGTKVRPAISLLALLIYSPLAGAAGGCLLYFYVLLLGRPTDWDSAETIVVVVGSGFTMLAVLSVGLVHLALLGRGLGIQAHDGVARIWRQLLVASMIWTFSGAVVEFGPLLVRWIIRFNTKTDIAALCTLWLVWSSLGLLAARSARSGEMSGQPPLIARFAQLWEGLRRDIDSIEEVEWKQITAFIIKLPLKLLTVFTSRELVGVLATSAPYVYAVGAVLATSTVVHVGLVMIFQPGLTSEWLNYYDWRVIQGDYWNPLGTGPSIYILGIATVLLLSSLVLSYRLGSNTFSVNYFFQSRLVRYYLGASNPDRKPGPSIDLDPTEDFPLGALACNYTGPYPILNATLSVTNSQELGHTPRAKSFMFTPLYCGYDLVSFNPFNSALEYLPSFARTEFADVKGSIGAFGSAEGVSLGTAMVVSGAGSNRYIGYYPVHATSIFMQLFDVRLGWWIGNPQFPEKWIRARTGWGLMSTFIHTSNLERGYVYLTDGGHFDNLGVYELLRRRCKVIVACDAELDDRYTFQDMATLVERARADLGVRIEIDLNSLKPSKGERQTASNFSVGYVSYSPNDPEDRAMLIYIKIGMPSSGGDHSRTLPHDVWNYFEWHKAFPHEATTRQWFDEQQFESYRALGEYIGLQASNRIGDAIEQTLRRPQTVSL